MVLGRNLALKVCTTRCCCCWTALSGRWKFCSLISCSNSCITAEIIQPTQNQYTTISKSKYKQSKSAVNKCSATPRNWPSSPPVQVKCHFKLRAVPTWPKGNRRHGYETKQIKHWAVNIMLLQVPSCDQRFSFTACVQREGTAHPPPAEPPSAVPLPRLLCAVALVALYCALSVICLHAHRCCTRGEESARSTASQYSLYPLVCYVNMYIYTLILSTCAPAPMAWSQHDLESLDEGCFYVWERETTFSTLDTFPVWVCVVFVFSTTHAFHRSVGSHWVHPSYRKQHNKKASVWRNKTVMLKKKTYWSYMLKSDSSFVSLLVLPQLKTDVRRRASCCRQEEEPVILQLRTLHSIRAAGCSQC